MGTHYPPDPDFDLKMWDMARAMNIEISVAITQDMLSIAALGKMMRSCHYCLARPFCALFLESRQGQTTYPPSFCPNRKRLAALQAVAEENRALQEDAGRTYTMRIRAGDYRQASSPTA